MHRLTLIEEYTGVASLSQMVVLVTGASSGLGAHLAEALASAGAHVVMCARRKAKLEEVVAKIRLRSPDRIEPFCMDVAQPADVVAAFDFAEKAFGTVNGLVNCAAILAAGPATDIPAEAVEHLLNTNLKGLFLTSREAAKRLIQTEQPGRIVNIASAAAFGYSPKLNTALYTASKAGVIRLTETLALEWARHNINVNAIAPGYFRSEMSAEFVETYGSRVSSRFPRQRMGEPEYLVGTLFYLLSEASHFVTGTCIIADDAQFTR